METKFVLFVCLIHLVYYTYLFVISVLFKVGDISNTPNEIISKLRSEYKINIRTFQRNSHPYGTAWFKTIYLNESLFKKPRALRWMFFHELYHIQNNHKLITLILRALFSFIPLILLVNGIVFMVVYAAAAYGLTEISNKFESNANEYANKMTSGR